MSEQSTADRPMPIFPLVGSILLPGQLLPLHLFEPRYVAMGHYAHKNNLPIGMIQPVEANGPLYDVGCCGEITEFEQTEDGRIDLVIKGTQRFKISEEFPMHDEGFRLVQADSSDFHHDVEPQEGEEEIPSTAVIFALRNLMEGLGMRVNIDQLDAISGHQLVDILGMLIPFPSEDKQAILEAENAEQRFALMRHLAAIYTTNPDASSRSVH